MRTMGRFNKIKNAWGLMGITSHKRVHPIINHPQNHHQQVEIKPCPNTTC